MVRKFVFPSFLNLGGEGQIVFSKGHYDGDDKTTKEFWRSG